MLFAREDVVSLVVAYLDEASLRVMVETVRQQRAVLDRAGRAMVETRVMGLTELRGGEWRFMAASALRWRPLNEGRLVSGNAEPEGPPDGRTWVDYFFEDGSTESVVACLYKDVSYSVVDPDGVLETRHVAGATRIEAHRWLSNTLPVRVQVKCLPCGCGPEVLYDICDPISAGQRTRTELGMDADNGELAAWTIDAELGVALVIPPAVWPAIRWRRLFFPRVGISRVLVDPPSVAHLMQLVGRSKCAFTVGGDGDGDDIDDDDDAKSAADAKRRRYRTDLATVLQVAETTPRVLCMAEMHDHRGLASLVSETVRRIYPRDSVLTAPFDVLPSTHRPAPVCVVVGSAGAASADHVDPFAWRGWHLLLSGTKVWKFYRRRPRNGSSVVLVPAASSFGPALGAARVLDTSSPEGKALESSAPSVVITQRPGDLLFFPGDVWHRVEHSEGVTVAVCGQFVVDPEATLRHIAHFRGLARVGQRFADLRLPHRLQAHFFLRLATLQEEAGHPQQQQAVDSCTRRGGGPR